MNHDLDLFRLSANSLDCSAIRLKPLTTMMPCRYLKRKGELPRFQRSP
jgi:hypothetical protein